ncbi:MAG: hypothetical protein E7464_06745 [Ruminococcaceae bacterium]|nr:hypothetical protein [Oscillospiraceae bacterium]
MSRKKADQELAVVRRATGYRVLGVLLIVLQLCAVVICFIDSVQTGIAMLLPLSITLFLTSLLLAYYLIWNIRFSEKKIKITSLFYRREYDYSQIKDVIGYSPGMGPDVVWLIFADGKKVTIYSNDIGFAKAKKILLMHRRFSMKAHQR